MTPLKILGPPRSGRKVLTEKQCLEELSNWSKQSKKDVLPKAPNTRDSTDPAAQAIPSLKNHPYFIAPGRFKVGTIEIEISSYRFLDLELPMGSWEFLELSADLISKNLTFDEWGSFNQSSFPKGVMPADIRYGLMTVCYLNRDKQGLKEVIADIKNDIWLPDANTDTPHNSTKLTYINNCEAWIIPGAGWKAGHPFQCVYKGFVAGPNSSIGTSKDNFVGPALECVLGEDDPKRCASVLAWASESRPARLWRYPITMSDQFGVLFDTEDRWADLSFYEDLSVPRKARAVRADPNYFSRK